MPSNPAATTLVVVRNGIFSNPAAMVNLKNFVISTLARSTHLDDPSYRWQDPVLHSGTDLAEKVLEYCRNNPGITKIVFAGHSQGGLVCRVAVAALCVHSDMLTAVRKRRALDPAYYGYAETQLSSMGLKYGKELATVRTAVHSVLMLGTPNAGAFTNGQLALQGTIALQAAKSIAALGGWKNFDELTTEKLFRVLQELRVPRVRYVSISGSSFNRYHAGAWPSLASLPLISRLAPALELPNDYVVEDSSVNLRKAPLPPELADIDTQYRHVRAYIECILTSHTSIHSDTAVFDALKAIPDWQ